jgi:hypothetical protein
MPSDELTMKVELKVENDGGPATAVLFAKHTLLIKTTVKQTKTASNLFLLKIKYIK